MFGLLIKQRNIGLVDLLVISYLLDTLIFAFFIPDPTEKTQAFIFRGFSFATILFILYHRRQAPGKATQWIKDLYPWIFLIPAFHDVSSFTSIVFSTPFDAHWQHIDYKIVGSFFHKLKPDSAMHNLYTLAHMSYAFLLIAFVFRLKNKNPVQGEKAAFLVLNSILWLYILFMVLPSTSPNSSLFTSGEENPIGWISAIYSFLLQHSYGAFPSAPIALSLVISIWGYSYDRWLFKMSLFMLVLGLGGAILSGFHTMSSVIAGLLIAPLLFWGSQKVYRLYERIMDEL
jgi:hypothetical protein